MIRKQSQKIIVVVGPTSSGKSDLAIKIAKKNAIKVIGIEVSGKKFYYENDLTGRVMLIIGGEDHPLSEEITNQCDLVVKIPLHGRVNSLNMSVAASIVIYDKIRQEYQSKIQEHDS